MRPGIEDWLGAGAVLSELSGVILSAEAKLALSSFLSVQKQLKTLIRDSESGQELTQRGFAADVDLACEENVSEIVPRLHQDRYLAAEI